MAKRWEISEDGLTWIFHLRDDVLWNDGEPFSADDVVFTFNQLIYNDTIPSSSRDIFTIDGKIFKVTKVDDYVVKFVLPVKFAPFLQSLSQEILPKHRLEKVVSSGKFTFSWGIDVDPSDIVGLNPKVEIPKWDLPAMYRAKSVKLTRFEEVPNSSNVSVSARVILDDAFSLLQEMNWLGLIEPDWDKLAVVGITLFNPDA